MKMRTRLFLVLCVLSLALLACVLPAELGPYLPFLPTITAPPPAPLTDTPAWGTITATPFLPAENTATFTPSATATFTQTFTPTLTLTATATGSPSATFTLSPTPSRSGTSTLTFTPSLSRTPTRTGSTTSTPTASRSATVTLTPGPSLTPTRTLSPVPSQTQTSTNTRTSLPPPTEIVPPTATLTASLTSTSTQIPTLTDTGTPTLSPVPSQTFTSTLIPNTPTATVVQPTRTPTATNVPQPGCAPSFDSGLEDQIVALLNQERINNGLPALVVQPALTTAARLHGQDMACNGFFSHIGSDGSTAAQRVARQGYAATWVGENIYGGMMSNPLQVVTWWMNSTAHRANILHSQYTSLGIGYVYLPSSPWQKYWVAVFARP